MFTLKTYQVFKHDCYLQYYYDYHNLVYLEH